MGCSISCAYFERFSFLEWVVKSKSQLQSVLHYRNVFFVFVAEGVDSVYHAAAYYGAGVGGLLPPEKTEGTVTVITF